MNTYSRSGFMQSLFNGLWGALQWRVLLLWVIALGIAALVGTFPLWQSLDAALSHSVHAAAMANKLDMLALGDVLNGFRDGKVASGLLASTVIALSLAPWLTGVCMAASRPGLHRLGDLAAEGMREYGRQLRLWVWACIPLGAAIALAMWWMKLSADHAEVAVLESSATHMRQLALLAGAIVILLVHAGIELTRARMAVRDDTRSVIRAWWRSLRLFIRRPFSVIGLYLLTALLGYAVVALLAWLRLHVAGVTVLQFISAVLLAQVLVAAIAWVRSARLRALTRLVADDAARTYKEVHASG